MTDEERPMTDDERPMTDDERPIPDEERQIPAFFIHSVTRKPVGEQDACWRPAIEPSNSQALVLGIERRHTQRAAHPNAPLARSVRGFSEISDNAGILSDIIRRQAIVFQGVQSKLSYVLGIVMNVVRVPLVACGAGDLHRRSHQAPPRRAYGAPAQRPAGHVGRAAFAPQQNRGNNAFIPRPALAQPPALRRQLTIAR